MIHPLLANTGAPIEGEGLLLDILPWMIVILLLVIVLVATIYIGRRMVRADGGDTDHPFTLQSLRDLHAAGQLSDEEFERARDALIGRVKAAASKHGSDGSIRRKTDDAAGDDDLNGNDEAADPDQADNNDGDAIGRKPPE